MELGLQYWQVWSQKQDDELQDALDKYQNRFRLSSYVDVVRLINGDGSNKLVIDMNWIYKALARTNKSDPIRVELIAYINSKLI